MNAAEIRARLAAPAPPAPPPLPLPSRSDEGAMLPREAAIPAAVLVGLVFGPSPGVLLTKRTEHLSSHAGQVSFPGGRLEPSDAGAEAAALREAAEETGLDPARVELAGRLPDYLTSTGFKITPVLGLLQPPTAGLAELALRPSPAEVEAVFLLPLAVLLDAGAPQRRRALLRGRWREFWVWPHPQYEIWGATAGILVHLAARLRGG